MLTLMEDTHGLTVNLVGKFKMKKCVSAMGALATTKLGQRQWQGFELCQQQFSLMVTQGQKEDPGLLTLLSLWKAATRVSSKDHFPGDAIALLFTGDTNIFFFYEWNMSIH